MRELGIEDLVIYLEHRSEKFQMCYRFCYWAPTAMSYLRRYKEPERKLLFDAHCYIILISIRSYRIQITAPRDIIHHLSFLDQKPFPGLFFRFHHLYILFLRFMLCSTSKPSGGFCLTRHNVIWAFWNQPSFFRAKRTLRCGSCWRVGFVIA